MISITRVYPAHLVMLLVAGLLPALCSHAQESPLSATRPVSTNEDVITRGRIKDHQEQLESETSLDVDQKARATQLYQQALEQMSIAERWSRRREEWTKQLDAAPALMTELKKKTASPDRNPSSESLTSATLDELTQKLATARKELSNAEEELQTHVDEEARRKDRRANITLQQQQARQRLSELEESIGNSSETSDPPLVVRAQKDLYHATLLATKRELELLEQEAPFYEATDPLLGLQREATEQAVARQRKVIEQMQGRVAAVREQQALEQTQEAQLIAENTNPALRELADTNVKLSGVRSGPEAVNTKLRVAEQARDAMQNQLADLQALEKDVNQLMQPGIVLSSGPLLYENRGELEELYNLHRDIYSRSRKITKERVALAELRRFQTRRGNHENELEAVSAAMDSRLDDRQRTAVLDMAAQLLRQRDEILKDLDSDHDKYLTVLIELNAMQQELATRSHEIREQIDDSLLWVRTGAPLGAVSWGKARASWFDLFGREQWLRVAQDARHAAFDYPVRLLLVLTPLIAFTFLRWPIRQRLWALNQEAVDSYLAPYRTTIHAFGLTVIVALCWPAWVLGVGYILNLDFNAALFSHSVASALMGMGVVFLLLELLRNVFRSGRMAETHFHWNQRRLALFQRHLRWLMGIGLPLVFLLILAQSHAEARGEENLNRLLQILLMTLIALFMQRILQPLPPLSEGTPAIERSWGQKFVYRLAIALPVFVALLAATGFQFTAWNLSQRIFYSVAMGIGMLLFDGLAVRWLRLARGNLALDQAAQRREAIEQAARSETVTAEDAMSNVEPEIDLATVNVHTRHLVRLCLASMVVVGIWTIWLDVLPDGGLLDHGLWSTTTQTTTSVTGPDGAPVDRLITETVSTTVADLILAIAIGIISIMVANNLPGLVEVGVPQNAPLDSGARYALGTILRYSIFAVGLVASFAILGVEWSRIQWLAAALSVGIGFGLQEIVANFVCGILLLFERPVRVGDTVTVDQVTGLVTRIQIRATTIRNWDRQEYIVPNKQLITGQVLNWTLSSELNRIVINVGVAYGTNAQHVSDVLTEILNQHPNVVKDPSPVVTFEQFGDSTLDFVIRAFLQKMEGRLATINSLHMQINERFSEEGIEIAFPQRDLHIRTVPAELSPRSGDAGEISSLVGRTHTN